MAAVFTQRLGETHVLVSEGGMIVDINDVVGFRVGSEIPVDFDDGLTSILNLGSPYKGRAGWNGADDGDDAIGLGEDAH